MKSKNKNIHRGEVLKAVVSRSGQKIKQIVRKAGYSRSSYYNHIEEPELDLLILEAYGKALLYDFTEEIPEMNKYVFEDPAVKYGPRNFEEAVRQLEQLRNKYDQFSEKHNQLIEKYDQLHDKCDQLRDKYDQLRDEYIHYLKKHKLEDPRK